MRGSEREKQHSRSTQEQSGQRVGLALDLASQAGDSLAEFLVLKANIRVCRMPAQRIPQDWEVPPTLDSAVVRGRGPLTMLKRCSKNVFRGQRELGIYIDHRA